MAVLAASIFCSPLAVAQPQTGSARPDLAPNATEQFRASYVLGQGDQIQISAFEVEELHQQQFRIDETGILDLPLAGKVKAAGMTVAQLETEISKLLREFVKVSQFSIRITQYRTDPVFLVGAFKSPGIYPLYGRRTLVELVASLGGLQPNAGRRIRLTRRSERGKIPLSNAVEDAERGTSYVEISVGSFRENVDPAEDIQIFPYDILSVERAEMIYVNGEVGKVGAFELGERESMSLTQLLTLAGGLTREADPTKAKIMRPVLNTARRAEIPIDVKKVLTGEANDFPLMPNDLLYVPKSARRVAFGRAGLVALGLIPTLIFVALR